MDENKKHQYYSECSPEVLFYNIIYHLKEKGFYNEEAEEVIHNLIFGTIKKEND